MPVLNELMQLKSKTSVDFLANAPTSAAKQINLYAIMRENGIVYDFMIDVIRRKIQNAADGFLTQGYQLLF